MKAETQINELAEMLQDQIHNGASQSDIIQIIEEYARIQIEKDRERVKADFKPEHFCDDYHYNMVQKGIDNTPINLD